MGWLGWSEQVTLDTSIPAIELAYEGRVEMLRACFGSGDETPPPDTPAPAPVVPMTPEAIMGVFRSAAR